MKNILVGIDFTQADEKVLSWAKQMAGEGSTLHLVHLREPIPSVIGYAAYAYPGNDDTQEELQEEKSRLSALVDALAKEGLQAKAFMKEGHIVDGLLEFAEQHEDGLLILGTHSRNLFERALLGSTTDRVVRKSKVPVLVVPTL